MPKYLIRWDAGFGEDWEVAEHATEAEAQDHAYEAWRDAAENHADYSAKVLTPELAKRYGAEDELEGSE